MFTLFTDRRVGGLKRSFNMAAPYYRPCNFLRNISTNISALRQRTHLKLGELSSLFIVYNIFIFCLYPLLSFWFYFFIAWQSTHSILNQEYLLKYWSGNLHTWHQKCSSQLKQNETCGALAKATLLAPVSFCQNLNIPICNSFKWKRRSYMEQTWF